jgi:Stress responsive A/B Barrel Domain
MIRNVVMGKLKNPSDPAASSQLDEGLAGIAALDLPGQLAMHVGRDAGLREGAWTFAITNDWVDAEAYRAYDIDEEHNRHRRLIVEVCDVARVQLAID